MLPGLDAKPLQSSLTQLVSFLRKGIGASLIGFFASGIGAVVRAVLDKLRDTVSVRDYGAVGDGVADDTAAINACLAAASASRHRVTFPTGVYKVSDMLNWPTDGISISGAGMKATRIISSNLSAPILNLFYVGTSSVSDMSLGYSGTPLNGAIPIKCFASTVSISDVFIENCFVGVDFQIGAGMSLSNCWINDYESIGVRCKNVTDVYISNLIMNAGTLTRGVFGGLRLEDKAEAINLVNVAILNGVYSITTDAAVYGQATRPAYCKFVSVYCDSAAEGCSIDKMVESSFTNCWFSNGRTGAGFPGCTLKTTDSISFNGGTSFFNCGSHGLLVNTGSVRTMVNGCFFESNSVTAGAAVAHGALFGVGVSSFMFIGNTMRNGMYSGGQQGYGVLVQNGASDKYIIKDNNGDGCATGAVADGGTGLLAVVRDNIGYNPRGASAVTVGASPYTYRAGHCPETLYIASGTVSLIVQSGAAIWASTDKTVHLEPNESIEITYSSVPLINRMVH